MKRKTMVKIELALTVHERIRKSELIMLKYDTMEAKQKYIDDCEQEFIVIPHNKFLEFKEFADTGKTKKFHVVNKSEDVLGIISWSPRWRRYSFSPTTKFATEHDGDCLVYIGYFIQKLMEKRKNEKNMS